MSTYSYSYYQQQQPALQAGSFSTQQGGMTWNGSQWVSSTAAAAPAPFPGSYAQLGTNSTWQQNYPAPQAQQQQNAPPPAPPAPPGHASEPAPTGNEDPSVLVTRYSLYYQSWKAQADEQRGKANILPMGQERDEASRRAQWAEYYANQSSASAHHYNGLVQQRLQHGGAPPPSPLQQQHPAPAQQEKRKTRWSDPDSSKSFPSPGAGSVPKPKLSGPPASSADRKDLTSSADQKDPPPESLKRYVHRCLSRCATDAQRTAMQTEVERTISENIRAGTMHSTDWDHFELLKVPDVGGSSVRPVSASSSSSGSPPSREGGSQNKRARTGGSDSSPYNNNARRKFGGYDDNLPANDSYYGSGGVGNGSYTSKFGGKQNLFLDITTGRSQKDSRNDSSKRNFDGGKHGGGYVEGLPANDSYYGSYGPSRDDASARSDDRSRGSVRGRGEDGSLASEQDFISLSPHGRKQSKKKQNQKKANQKSQQQKQAAYKRSTSAASTGSENNGFERSNKTLAARASRFSGRGGISDAVGATSRSDAGINVDRYMGKGVISGAKKVLNEIDYEHMTVKGHCAVLEKDYLRLTSPPRAELVRPKHILEKHLSNLKKLWGKTEKDRGGNGKRDYLWFCSQLKAMRQDLTVQRIFDPFTVEVYETHARISLEKGDLNEYNQCQTQLKELYEQLSHAIRESFGVAASTANASTDKKEANQGDGKKKKKAKDGLENQHEFIAYRLLYYVYLTGNKKYDGGSSDLFKIMLSLSPEQREDPVISHALKVRVAVAEFDYHAFFSLQDSAPKMGAYLMDYLVPQVRQAALQRMHKAYRPAIPVKRVLKELGFDGDDPQDAADGRKWLLSCGCKLSADHEIFLTKDSILKESGLVNKKSSLI
mmetsp:Transcript_3476/g.9069  ORF Transcript_3476/g.9069 Transcript_3476/m.9069 type:complete len:881 (-) Transcript_3476:737-3379(-)